MRNSTLCAAIAALLLSVGSASAHHTFSKDFDSNKPVTLTGTVTKIQWGNPHAYAFIDVTDDKGKITNWKVELGSPGELMKTGWTGASLQVGQKVTMNGFRAKNGTAFANAQSLITADGQTLSAASSYDNQTPAATSGKTP